MDAETLEKLQASNPFHCTDLDLDQGRIHAIAWLQDPPAPTQNRLKDFVNLYSLSMEGCGCRSLEGFPASLQKMKRLNLAENDLRSVQPLADAGLGQLRSLDLRQNPHLTSVAALVHLPALKHVRLEGSGLDQGPGYRADLFAALPNLITLDGTNRRGMDVDSDAESDIEEEVEEDEEEDDEEEEEGEDSNQVKSVPPWQRKKSSLVREEDSEDELSDEESESDDDDSDSQEELGLSYLQQPIEDEEYSSEYEPEDGSGSEVAIDNDVDDDSKSASSEEGEEEESDSEEQMPGNIMVQVDQDEEDEETDDEEFDYDQEPDLSYLLGTHGPEEDGEEVDGTYDPLIDTTTHTMAADHEIMLSSDLSGGPDEDVLSQPTTQLLHDGMLATPSDLSGLSWMQDATSELMTDRKRRFDAPEEGQMTQSVTPHDMTGLGIHTNDSVADDDDLQAYLIEGLDPTHAAPLNAKKQKV